MRKKEKGNISFSHKNKIPNEGKSIFSIPINNNKLITISNGGISFALPVSPFLYQYDHFKHLALAELG